MTPSQDIPPRDEVQQGVVVVVHGNGRFLMIRRAAKVLAAGVWCFVGGAIKPGETQSEAVMREFAEEVGGRVRALRKIWEYGRPDGKLLLHWWLAKLERGALKPNPLEVDELRWCTPAEIELLPQVLESNVHFMREVGRGLVEGAVQQ
jgi:8-oxo-dGTP diphosphatase